MRNKIGIVFMTTFIALALMGTSYSMWSDQLFMYGTVNTGNIGLEWSIEGCGDSEPPEKQDVSNIVAEINQDGDLIITITNAYPCIDYWVDFNVHGIGSVPAHVDTFLYTYNPDPFQGTIEIEAAPGYGPITAYQFHNCDRWYGRITIHLAQTAVQNGVYQFTVQLDYRQWNGEGNEEPLVQPKAFSWAAFSKVSYTGYSGGLDNKFPSSWVKWTATNSYIDITGAPFDSWDETDFSTQIYDVDLTRQTIGSDIVWNFDISNVAGQWAIDAFIVISDSTATTPLFMLRWATGDGYPTYQYYSGGWSAPTSILPPGMQINTDYTDKASPVHFDFTIPVSYL